LTQILIYLVLLLSFHQYVKGQNIFSVSDAKLLLNLNNFEDYLFTDTIFDQSGNLIHFYQPLSSSRPTIVNESLLNFHNTFRFDGVDDYMFAGDKLDLDTSGATFFIVAKSLNEPGSPGGLLSKSLLGGAPNRYSFITSKNSLFSIYIDQNDKSFTTPVKSNNFNIYAINVNRQSKTISTTIVNDTSLSVSGINDFNYNFNSPFNLILGAYNNSNDDGASLFLNGNIAELIAYNKSLDSSQTNTVVKYLRLKFAPPVSLGKDTCVTTDSFNISAQNRFVNYLWSNGDTTHFTNINQSGSYWIKTTDVFGFVSYDTININLINFTSLNNQTICSGKSTSLNLNLTGNFSYSWNNGDTASSLIVNSAGSYFCTITDSLGCSVISDTAIVSVDNFNISASLGPDTNLCAGNVLYLKNGADVATNYSWSNGSTDSTLSITQSGTYWLHVNNLNGCSITDTINVIVNGFAPNTLFTLNDACINDSVAFIDLSTTQQPGDVISSWFWNFGDGNTSSLQNPKHQYDTAGNYIVSLETTTNSGCSKVRKVNYKVYPLPVPSFSILNNCQYANTQFTFNGNTYGDMLTGIKWQFGNNPEDTANSISPVFVFTQSGTQPLTITINTEKGCVISKNFTVNIKQGPLADFYASEACAGENITLVDISDVNFPHTIINREWNFGDGTWAGNSATPSHFYISPGKYNVYLKVTASSGCSDTVIKTITIDPKPVANFNFENNCLNSPTLFTNSTGINNVGGILWEIDDLFSTTQDPFNYVFNDTGRYAVRLIIKTEGGCADTVTKTITIGSLPIADFNLINSEEDLPVSIVLENKSLNASNFLWNFDDGNVSSSPNPVHVYSKEDDYTIKLFAFNNQDCVDSAQKDIRIKSARFDLALLDISPVINNKGFLEPEIRIANLGTRIINNFDVYLIINGENSISENWNGTLMPGQNELYRLKSSAKINMNENFYTCISLANPNKKIESDTTNNILCKELLGDNLVLADISPNPANESILAPIISPDAGKGFIYIYSKSGQLVREHTIELIKGIQLVPVNIEDLNNGLYTLSVSFKDKLVSKRFMKE
jgi:PKD repeat protein